MRTTIVTMALLLFIACQTPDKPLHSEDTKPTYVVTKILDGEVFEAIDREGEVLTFKLAGIDCLDFESIPDDPYYQEFAADTWTEMFIILSEQEITVEYDRYKKDPEGRHIVYAYLSDGSMVNETLLRSGIAEAEDYLYNRKYLDHFKALEGQARMERAGHWLGYYGD